MGTGGGKGQEGEDEGGSLRVRKGREGLTWIFVQGLPSS